MSPVPTVQTHKTDFFVYTPPAAAFSAQRILLKPNLGYPVGPPATVSMGVLKTTLRGLRQANPKAEILIVEGVCSPESLDEIAAVNGLTTLLRNLNDPGIRLLDADTLPLQEYPNLSPAPVKFASMWAPALLQEVDCRISLGALKQTTLNHQPLVSASLKNLYGLFPRAIYRARSLNSRGKLHLPSVPQVLQDIYFSIGHLFDGGIVDGHERYYSKTWKPDRKTGAIALGKIFSGTDLIAVDREACRLAEMPMPEYLDVIDTLRQKIKFRSEFSG
ncbi:MAG: DUF362 domain-containing protein [Synechococcales cyanobacterium CRU_2_2]|nr:DUF362 domain-containing protein [Synechococcales cyanobacterium CRU_2_2]